MIPTNEQIVHDLATAWRTLNLELIIKHLATTFQYDSMWVFESLDYEGYSKYIRGKFHTLKRSGSQLTIQKVPGRKAISISQDGKEPVYYVIKIKDGKIVKGDLTAFVEFSEPLE